MSRRTEAAVRDLEAEGLDTTEAEVLLVPEGAAERAEDNRDRICRDYLNATHPDTGLAVVFVPGERLPDWALDIQEGKQADPQPPAPTVPEAKSSIKAEESPSGSEPAK